MAKKDTKVKDAEKKETAKKGTKQKDTKVKNERKKIKQIDRSELIPCKNVCDNIVVFVSPRTGVKYTWSNYGDIEYIEFGELMTMKSSHPKFLEEPWLIPIDEDVVEFLRLNKIYEKIIPMDNIEDFFTEPIKDIRSAIRKAPKGNREALAIRAKKMVKDGTLYDNRIIKIIEEELRVKLDLE